MPMVEIEKFFLQMMLAALMASALEAFAVYGASQSLHWGVAAGTFTLFLLWFILITGFMIIKAVVKKEVGRPSIEPDDKGH